MKKTAYLNWESFVMLRNMALFFVVLLPSIGFAQSNRSPQATVLNPQPIEEDRPGSSPAQLPDPMKYCVYANRAYGEGAKLDGMVCSQPVPSSMGVRSSDPMRWTPG